MGSDPFAKLRTYEEATPGPWRKEETFAHDWDIKVGPDDDEWALAIDLSDGDAAHIQTWDPETCREVVALLETAFARLRIHSDNDSFRFCERLDALLSRLEDTNGR